MTKVLVLKNDRAGDLFTSLKLIATLIRDKKKVTIYLSNLNYAFSFFFKKANIKRLNYNLGIINKFKIFLDILINQYEEIYILTPKNFYFYLPFFFRKIKFYGIVYDGIKRKRPNVFLRKFLFKFRIVSRKKINKYSYRELQEQLIENNLNLDNDFSSLFIPSLENKKKKIIPHNYIFFQFRYKFFEELKWTENNIIEFIDFLKTKYTNVLICSDIENNQKTIKYNRFFKENFSILDFNKNIEKINNNQKNVFYLPDLSGLDMFHLIKKSIMCISKEGIVSHISFFHGVKCHNLFNFKINNADDLYHQKVSYSEWCKGMNFNFSFLNENMKRTLRKIDKLI